MRILVTGASGSVGRRLVERLSASGQYETIYAQYRSPGGEGAPLPGVVWIRHDISEPLDPLDLTVDAVVHSAALRPASRCESDPAAAVSTNLLGTRHAVDFARRQGCRQFIYCSVQSVYQGHPPFREDHPTHGSDLYAITKLAGEMVVEGGLRGRVPYHILRMPHIYGESLAVDGILKTYRESGRKGALLVHGSGEQTGCFLHTDDFCDLVAQLLASPPAAGIYNVSSETISVLAIAQAFQDAYRVHHGQAVALVHEPASAVRSFGLDLSKIESATGWRPQHGVRPFIDWLVSQA